MLINFFARTAAEVSTTISALYSHYPIQHFIKTFQIFRVGVVRPIGLPSGYAHGVNVKNAKCWWKHNLLYIIETQTFWAVVEAGHPVNWATVTISVRHCCAISVSCGITDIYVILKYRLVYFSPFDLSLQQAHTSAFQIHPGGHPHVSEKTFALLETNGAEQYFTVNALIVAGLNNGIKALKANIYRPHARVTFAFS